MTIPRIRLLNRLLADQIAAGEVVERPASVLKELMENSIDSGATQIDVVIQEGGFRLIKVRDDGCGIEQHDLRLAVSRHATSKIAAIEDLSSITSLGFRGEALASIASVSRFWISSKPAHQTQAWQLHLDGSEAELELQPTSHPTGTTVVVQDLFFNTPARRKFMRSEKTEYLQMEEVFKRIALSHLSIGFTFTYNQRTTYRLLAATTAAQQQRRIAKVFGNPFLENACHVDMQATDLAVTGWLGLPNFSRSQNDLQYVYLNGRLVRDRVINHALRQAYDDLLPTGRHAVFVLYLTVNPSIVDVNVHPTKHEVRFPQARLIHDFLVYAVRRGLQHLDKENSPAEEQQAIAVEKNWLSAEKPFVHVAETAASYEKLPEPIIEPVVETIVASVVDTPVEAPARLERNPEPLLLVQEVESFESEVKTKNNPWGRPLALLQKRWLMSETENGVLLIDTYGAQWTLAVKQAQDAYKRAHLPAQPLLFPHTQVLKKNMIAPLLEYTDRLKEVGITVEQLAPTTIVVRTLPRLLADLDKNGFLLALCEQLRHFHLEISDILTLAGQYVIPMALISTFQQQALLEDLHLYMPLNFSKLPAFCDLMTYEELSNRVGVP